MKDVGRLAVLAALGLAGAIAVPACGSSNGGGGGGGSTSLAQACVDLATSQCNQQQACDPSGLASVYADVASCIARTQLTCPVLAQAPGSGYQPAAIEACARALATATCADVANNVGPAACQIRGTLPVGAACADDSQCASAENYCRLSGSCGVCVARQPVSDPNNPLSFGACAGTDACQDGLVCYATLCAATVAPSGACDVNHPCNFLADMESTQRDQYALDDLALRDPALRRAHRQVQVLGKALQARIGGPDWVRFTDARTRFQTALFELAFNLGFENGMIRTRSEMVRQTHATDSERALGDELRRIVALSGLTAERAAVAVISLACALADSPLASWRER